MTANVANLKQQAHDLIDQLDPVQRWDDLAYHFALRASVERGLEDVRAGRVVDGEEVMRWIESWGTADELPPPAR